MFIFSPLENLAKNNQKAKKDQIKAGKAVTQEPPKNYENVIFYTIAFFLCCTYGVYVYDKNAFENYANEFTPLQPLKSIFDKFEQFSPFIEFLEDDNWASLQEEKVELVSRE